MCGTDVDILNNSTNQGQNGCITGYNTVEIRYCFNLGDITKTGNNTISLGGITGTNATGGKIVGCYNRGNITGTSKIGGLVGAMHDTTKKKAMYILQILIIRE